MSQDCSPVPAYLFETDQGSVYRCPCCDRLEVTFKHFTVALTDEAFQRLCDTNQLLLDWVERHGPCTTIDFKVKTDAGLMLIPLFPFDAFDLKELLDGTAAMMELETMLKEVLS